MAGGKENIARQIQNTARQISETVRNGTHIHINFFLRMTDTVTSPIIDLSSWDTLYSDEWCDDWWYWDTCISSYGTWVLSVMSVKITVLSYETPCSLVDSYQRLREIMNIKILPILNHWYISTKHIPAYRNFNYGNFIYISCFTINMRLIKW
jgi:hypothetical protein